MTCICILGKSLPHWPESLAFIAALTPLQNSENNYQYQYLGENTLLMSIFATSLYVQNLRFESRSFRVQATVQLLLLFKLWAESAWFSQNQAESSTISLRQLIITLELPKSFICGLEISLRPHLYYLQTFSANNLVTNTCMSEQACDRSSPGTLLWRLGAQRWHWTTRGKQLHPPLQWA